MDGAAAPTDADADARCGTRVGPPYASRSRCMTRPPGPLGTTSRRSMPRSQARARSAGEAIGRAPSWLDAERDSAGEGVEAGDGGGTKRWGAAAEDTLDAGVPGAGVLGGGVPGVASVGDGVD